MPPARLHERHLLIGKIGHHHPEDIHVRTKIRIQDEQEIAASHLASSAERTGLVARAVGAMQAFDVKPLSAVVLHLLLAYIPSIIGGVIENLNLKLILRVIDTRHLSEQPLHHVALVKHGELDCDHGQLIPHPGGHGHIAAVFQVEQHHQQSVEPIPRHAYHHQKIGNKPCHTEPVIIHHHKRITAVPRLAQVNDTL